MSAPAPPGWLAAVCAASEGLKTIVPGKLRPRGGQAASSSLIENFFGFPTGISGGEPDQSRPAPGVSFRGEILDAVPALSLCFHDGEYRASLRVESCAAVLRGEVRHHFLRRRLSAHRGGRGRADFEGAGVYYAATAMEGALCRDRRWSSPAVAIPRDRPPCFFPSAPRKSSLVIRGGRSHQSMSSYLSTRVETKDNIEILRHTEIRKMSGGKSLEQVELENTQTGERRTVQTPAVFSMIGAKPCTEWLAARGRVRRAGIHQDRAGGGAGARLAGRGARAWIAGDQPSRNFRRGRRPFRLREALRRRGRGRRHGGGRGPRRLGHLRLKTRAQCGVHGAALRGFPRCND
ncbi:MAG: hypothetical protein WDN28_23810 [Chthoniobacter sp.]